MLATAEVDRIPGLELGADDYVTKPFSPQLLLGELNRYPARDEALDEAPEVVEVASQAVKAVNHHGVTIPYLCPLLVPRVSGWTLGPSRVSVNPYRI